MRLLFVPFILMSLMSGTLMAKNEAQIYGYVEKVTLLDKNITLSAKLDTGAKSASLNASNITRIEVKGAPWLRFTVPTKDGDHVFECPYIGKVKIKVRAQESNTGTVPIKRPMVLLPIKLGDKIRTIRVNLTNRKRFLYPLLLGRDAIKELNGAVNPAMVFTVKSGNVEK